MKIKCSKFIYVIGLRGVAQAFAPVAMAAEQIAAVGVAAAEKAADRVAADMAAEGVADDLSAG